MTHSPIDTLERWELYGALWRVRHLTERMAVVELCTCHGEPVDELRSSDPLLLEFLARRPSSEVVPSGGVDAQPDE